MPRFIVLLLLSVTLLSGCSQSPEQQLIGTWQLTKGDEGKLSQVAVEFAADHALKVTGEDSGVKFTVQGRYGIEKDAIFFTVPVEDKDLTTMSRIQKLTNDELVLIGPDDVVEAYRRVKSN